MVIEECEIIPPAADAHIDIAFTATCDCAPSHMSCITAKEWMKSQIGVWQFYYEGRDLRNKSLHPATYPISLSSKVIELFTHKGELVLDPFVGAGTTLISAMDLERNAVGFDLQPHYLDLTNERLNQNKKEPLFSTSKQLTVLDDARNIEKYITPGTVKLIVTSPPYANLLNRKRLNKSRRSDTRKNDQFEKVEQYSQDPRDLGILALEDYTREMKDIFSRLLPLLKPGAHCVIDVPDMWWENQRITIHLALIQALREVGYEFRNTIIWDRTNIVNKIGIFGWPNNYITMGTTFEYLLDFIRPKEV